MAKVNKLVATVPINLLITIVKYEKVDLYVDILEEFDVNIQMILLGKGTLDSNLFYNEIGARAIIFSFITEDNTNRALEKLKEKFDTIKNGRGVAFAIPISSVMGVSFFNFLSNNKNNLG